tara:strand:+ start:83 stop:367 length:285 start_codon:yes stop_codon:yes gene_type:complete
MSKKMRDAARGEHCTIGLAGCLPGTETVVLAHLPNRSIGKKNNDYNAAFACYSCHQALDGQRSHNFDPDWMDLLHRRGQEITLNRMVERKVIKS